MTSIIERLKHKAKVKPGQQVRVLPAEILAEIKKQEQRIKILEEELMRHVGTLPGNNEG